MKTQTNSLFTPVNAAVLVQFSAEVKETLALDFTQHNSKIFSAADMWSIERRKRARTQRRYF